MTQKNLNENKRKYDIFRHHAWAGSVLLAALVAVRGFLELSDVEIDDRIIIIIGMILVFYVLISVFLTYRYRSGLRVEQNKVVEVRVVESGTSKVEKKKVKADLKVKKKSSK